jgi:hypothetical protein
MFVHALGLTALRAIALAALGASLPVAPSAAALMAQAPPRSAPFCAVCLLTGSLWAG